MDDLMRLIECKEDLQVINWWPEGDSNREILEAIVRAVQLLIEIEIDRVGDGK